MFIEDNYRVGISDLTPRRELSNTTLLRCLENLGNMHSEIAGYGVTDMDRTRISWVLLSWKVKVIKRPHIGDYLNIKTWSAGIDRYFAYRDFEVKNQYGELVCIASSSWSMIDIDSGKIVKMADEVNEKYTTENKHVFENEMKRIRIKEPEEFSSKGEFKITRSLIDLNKHLHNIYYYDIAKEALPESVAFEKENDEFEIHYKKGIKLGEKAKYYYSVDGENHIVTIKNENNEYAATVLIKE
ncbi:MAG: hypothetical protein K6D97_01570 [Clostridia bacterium]|nr:hypothetical protein [Clostridia bacterium]